jgi:hypothetical protein
MEGMMKSVLLFFVAAALVFGADDPWAKVKALKTGTELRVYKRGSVQPLTVKMDELTDEDLVVISKNSQTAIPRDQIDRIEARPAGKTRTTTDTVTAEKNAATDPRSNIPGPNQPPGAVHAATTTASSGVNWTTPGYEMVYRRTAGTPPKK